MDWVHFKLNPRSNCAAEIFGNNGSFKAKESPFLGEE